MNDSTHLTRTGTASIEKLFEESDNKLKALSQELDPTIPKIYICNDGNPYLVFPTMWQATAFLESLGMTEDQIEGKIGYREGEFENGILIAE